MMVDELLPMIVKRYPGERNWLDIVLMAQYPAGIFVGICIFKRGR